MDNIKIGVAHRGAGLSPVFSALESGAFERAGLRVELVSCPGHPAALEALYRGEVDFINSVGPEVLLANRAHRGNAVVVASAIGRSAQQVSARAGITSLQQLKGARWGVITRNDADECSIAMAFERWGWSLATDAQIVAVGTAKPRLDALLDETRVDAVIMHAPEPFQAAKRGWQVISDLGQLDVAFQNSCAVTARDTIMQQPQRVERYVEAYCRGVWHFRTNPLFGVQVLRKYTGETDDSVLSQTWVLFARLMGGMMFPSVEGMRNAAHVLNRLGVLNNPPSAFEYVHLDSVAALERRGFFADLMGAR
jgi:ABC-type nitrate/sulfonate/bicarbonate transport system substrate-binding protein